MSCFFISIRRGRRDRTSGFTRDCYKGARRLSHIYIIVCLSRSSHGRILLPINFLVLWAKRLRKQTVFEPWSVACDHMYTLLRLKTKNLTNAEVVLHEYTRVTLTERRNTYFHLSDLSRVQLSSFFRPPQLPRSHRHYQRSRHSSLRNGISIWRLVTGNNNLRHTFFVSISLSKRWPTFSNSFSRDKWTER